MLMANVGTEASEDGDFPRMTAVSALHRGFSQRSCVAHWERWPDTETPTCGSGAFHPKLHPLKTESMSVES